MLQAVTVCPFCNSEVDLDENEIGAEQFVCPTCKKKVTGKDIQNTKVQSSGIWLNFVERYKTLILLFPLTFIFAKMSPLFAIGTVEKVNNDLIVHLSNISLITWILFTVICIFMTIIFIMKNIFLKLSGAILVPAVIVAIFIIPNLMHDSIRVSRETIEFETRAFYSPNKHWFSLVNVDKIIKHYREKKFFGFAYFPEEEWELKYKKGSREIMHLNDLFFGSKDEIEAHIKGYGIEVISN